MKKFRNINTNEIWTMDEVKESYEQFKYEISDDPISFEDYLDNLLDQGNQGAGGLVEVELYTADRETGTFIDTIDSIEDGIERIKKYEESDKQEGTFEEDFYDIVDGNHCHVEW